MPIGGWGGVLLWTYPSAGRQDALISPVIVAIQQFDFIDFHCNILYSILLYKSRTLYRVCFDNKLFYLLMTNNAMWRIRFFEIRNFIQSHLNRKCID
jgi:hypothetical protein